MDSVALLRTVVVLLLRAVAVTLAVWALFALADLGHAVIYAVRLGMGSIDWNFLTEAGAIGAAFALMGRALAAFLLAKFSGKLALWIVPRLTRKCIACGHTLVESNAGVCPECGAQV